MVWTPWLAEGIPWRSLHYAFAISCEDDFAKQLTAFLALAKIPHGSAQTVIASIYKQSALLAWAQISKCAPTSRFPKSIACDYT
jgi:hypothetical protein